MDGWHTSESYRERVAREKAEWEREVDRIHHIESPVLSQGAVIGILDRGHFRLGTSS